MNELYTVELLVYIYGNVAYILKLEYVGVTPIN